MSKHAQSPIEMALSTNNNGQSHAGIKAIDISKPHESGRLLEKAMAEQRISRALATLRTAVGTRAVTCFPLIGDRFVVNVVGGYKIKEQLKKAGFRFRGGAWVGEFSGPGPIESAFNLRGEAGR